MTNSVNNGNYVSFTNDTLSVISSGDVVVKNNLVGISVTDVAVNAQGTLALEGVFILPKQAALAIDQGTRVYWNIATSRITTDSSDVFVGVCIESVSGSASTVNVKLYHGDGNDGSGSAPAETELPLDNDNFLTSRNAANDSSINIIKVDSSDRVQLGDNITPLLVDALNVSIGTKTEQTGDFSILTGGVTLTDNISSTGEISIKTGDNASNSLSQTGTGQIVLETGALTGSTENIESGAIRLRTGPTKVYYSGPVELRTGASEYQSGDIFLITGQGLVPDEGWSGEIFLWTGGVTGTAESGDINLATGQAEDGPSGNINLTTGGTTTGARGYISMDALFLNLPKGSSDPTSAVQGSCYYNTSSDVIKYYTGSVWKTLTSS